VPSLSRESKKKKGKDGAAQKEHKLTKGGELSGEIGPGSEGAEETVLPASCIGVGGRPSGGVLYPLRCWEEKSPSLCGRGATLPEKFLLIWRGRRDQ